MKSNVLAPEKPKNLSEKKYDLIVLVGVLVVTALVFAGCLKLGWTNWDDNLYVYENPVVMEGKIKDAFIKPADNYNTYHPLVTTSFILEWNLVQDRPFLYHLDNILLHLICTVLVFFLFRSFGLSPWWSGFAALLFGIHPMRVESVAWISERKDLFYVLFYLAALLSYIRYLGSRKNWTLVLTFLFFTLSLVSKITAVTLPITLLLLDWYYKRKIDVKTVTEKIIFLAMALVAGLVSSTYFINKVYITTDSRAIVNAFSLSGQTVIAAYEYAVYILKSVWPYAVSTLYPIPSVLQVEHWAGAAISVTILLIALKSLQKSRILSFGLLFYTIHIFLFLVVPPRSSDSAFLNDRYTSIAYIGLFFILAACAELLYRRSPSLRLSVAGVAVLLLCFMGVSTLQYIPVWENSATLWTHVIEKYPHRIPVAYLNRGQYWYKNNQMVKALNDYDKAIEINPRYLLAYMNRGLLYLEENDTKNALNDYDRILELLSPYDPSGRVLNPPVSDALGNRGLIYLKTGQYAKALSDLDSAIRLNPSNPTNYVNRSDAYRELGKVREASRDEETARKLGGRMVR